MKALQFAIEARVETGLRRYHTFALLFLNNKEMGVIEWVENAWMNSAKDAKCFQTECVFSITSCDPSFPALSTTFSRT